MGMYTTLRMRCTVKPEFRPLIGRLREFHDASWEGKFAKVGDERPNLWDLAFAAYPQYDWLKQFADHTGSDNVPFGTNRPFWTEGYRGDTGGYGLTFRQISTLTGTFKDPTDKWHWTEEEGEAASQLDPSNGVWTVVNCCKNYGDPQGQFVKLIVANVAQAVDCAASVYEELTDAEPRNLWLKE